MDSLEAIKQIFFQECEEQLAELESGLLSIDEGAFDDDVVNAVFRAVHSIKGGAGAFGLDDLVRFAHTFETALDALRSHRIGPEPTTVRLFLRAADLLADLVRAAQGQSVIVEGRSATLEAELRALTTQPQAPQPQAADPEWDALMNFQPVRIEAPALNRWRIRFRPHAHLYANGNDPVVLLRELSRFGALNTTLDDSRLPGLAEMDPESAYLAWTVELETDKAEADLREVFEFVDEDCDLEIETIGAAATEPTADDLPMSIEDFVPVPVNLAEIAAVARAPEPADTVEARPARPASVQTDPPKRPDHSSATKATIRVDLDRLDRLIDLVGELVINQAVLTQRVSESGFSKSSGVGVGLEELEHLTREIQDSVMAIRAQPVKAVFQRLPRLAREVAALTKKEVRLVTEGESTEVDNTVIERLSDPLTHMIRNAIDHGIEAPEKRVLAGKPAEGTIRVAALHRSGRIVIEVADDGAGINRERVLAVAVSKGIVSADATLTDDEIDNLIFAPGFSTASSVSDISGRGVGMDVVRRSIQALGGRISISSNPGVGSVFSLSLPLTLAVLDGMVVGVQDGRFVVPLTAILETFQPGSVSIHQLGESLQVASIRGSYVPLIDVGYALGFRDSMPAVESSVALLVEAENGTRAALLVDVIHGQRQVVIKSLEANYRHVPGVAAATILGDGRVALILDVAAIVNTTSRLARPAELQDA